MRAILQVCVALAAVLSVSAAGGVAPSHIGAFTATFVPDTGAPKVLFEDARRAAGSNYFGIRPDAAPAETDCVYLAFNAEEGNFSTAGVTDIALVCHNRTHDATTFAGVDSNLQFNPVIAQRSFVPGLLPIWETPAGPWRVLYGAPLVALRYQPANLNPGVLDPAFALITEPIIVNPAAAVCVQGVPPLTSSSFPWVPAGALASIDCDWNGYDFETIVPRCAPSGLVLHFWDGNGGMLASSMEFLDLEEIVCSVELGSDDAGSVRFLVVIVDHFLEQVLAVTETLNLTALGDIVALDLYVDMQVFKPPIASTFTVHMRYQLDDLGGRDLVPMDVDVMYPGGFMFTSAAYLSREEDFSNVGGLISVDMVSASAPSSPGLDVSLATLFSWNEPFTSARLSYTYFTLSEPLLSQWNYTGAFALRSMDYWYYYDYYANVDLGWPSFWTQEFCAALDPAFMTDFGLFSGYKLLDPAVAGGSALISVLSADAMRVRRLFHSVAYVINGDSAITCQYALLPVAASDFRGPDDEPGFGGSAVSMRPTVVVRVELMGDVELYYDLKTFSVDDYQTTMFSPSPVATPETERLTNATVVVPLNGVPIASAPLDCTQWLAAMNRGIRENLAALLQVCNGAAAADDVCVSFRAYVAAGAHLFDSPLPTDATCPQLDITPMFVSETVDYAYYVPFTNSSDQFSGSRVNMVLSLVGYNRTRLCAYSRRADSLSDSYALYFPFALTAYPSQDLDDAQVDTIFLGSIETTYVDLGCDPSSAPYSRRFAPKVPEGSSELRASYTTEIEETSVGATPITGVENSVLQRAFNMTPADRAVFLGRLTSLGVAIDACTADGIASVFECDGAPQCVANSLATVRAGPSCARAKQERASRVAVGYTGTALRELASKVLMYAGASVATAAGAVLTLGVLLATQSAPAHAAGTHTKM